MDDKDRIIADLKQELERRNKSLDKFYKAYQIKCKELDELRSGLAELITNYRRNK